MMERLDLSVIVSVHANEIPEFFNSAMQSIFCSEPPVEEVIVVQDGNLGQNLSDAIWCWEEKFKGRLKKIVFKENLGLGASLNSAVKACTKDLVARMDTDDISFSNRFKRQFEFLQKNENIDIVGSFAIEINSEGIMGNLRSMPVCHDQIYQSLWACPFIHPTVMFRRNKILEAGNYNSNLRRRQDYELWFRCAKFGLHFANIPEPLLYYRFDRNTHRKQPARLAWEQGKIGFSGSSSLGLSWWKRVACFIPFIRSILPTGLQHNLYKFLKAFDPRSKY